jgi:hypothetical protein
VTLRRAKFQNCRDGKVIMPADKQLDLPAGCEVSPALAERSMWLATQMSFVHVQEGLERLLRVAVCDSVLDRLMQRVGSVAVKDRQAAVAPLVPLLPGQRESLIQPLLKQVPRRLYISCDGVMYPTRETVKREDGRGKRRLHREMKCGMVFWEDDRRGWVKQTISGREDAHEFGLRLWSLAIACGMHQAQEVIFISDGGRWCEQVHREYFSEFPRILDWYHLSEHVWEAARLIHSDPSKAQQWADRCLLRLEQRSGIGLLQLLQRSVAQHKALPREAIEKLINYLQPRLNCTDYLLYRDKGWIIGSGAMESTCKQVVGQRLKGAGRQWSESGAVAMAELTNLRLNNQWDELWLTRPMQRAA